MTSRNRMVRGICDFVVQHVTTNHKSSLKATGHMKMNL